MTKLPPNTKIFGPPHRRFGWMPDLPDHRDFKFKDKYTVKSPARLPDKVSIRAQMSPVRDQGNLGACTGFSTAAAVEFLIPGTIVSPLFIYYEERAAEGTIKSDAGANIRTGIKILNKIGAAAESLWSFDDGPKKFMTKPPAPVVKDAGKRKLTTYLRCTSIAEVQTALASNKPVVIGFTCYQSLESATVNRTGKIPMPKANDKPIGGHAICLTGYDMKRKLFEFKNSWSTAWGNKGYGYLPFGYLEDTDLADDFWCLQNETVTA